MSRIGGVLPARHGARGVWFFLRHACHAYTISCMLVFELRFMYKFCYFLLLKFWFLVAFFLSGRFWWYLWTNSHVHSFWTDHNFFEKRIFFLSPWKEKTPKKGDFFSQRIYCWFLAKLFFFINVNKKQN